MAKLAILGGKPICARPTQQVKYPLFTKAAIRKVVDLLEKGETVGLGRKSAPIAEAEDAIEAFHDIGGNGLTTSECDFRALCEYIARRRDVLWCVPMVEVAKKILDARL